MPQTQTQVKTQQQEHVWVAASTVPVYDLTLIHQAVTRGHLHVVDTFIDVSAVFCELCRLDYAAAFDTMCKAGVDNSHLIGGRVNKERAKRLHTNHNCFDEGCGTAEVIASQQNPED